MHFNPVKRGLVESPKDWKWSSYRFYWKNEKGFAIRTHWGNGRSGGNSKPLEVEQVTENPIKKKPQVLEPKTCGTLA